MKYKLGYTEEECVAMEKEKRKGGGDRREGDGTMWQCMEHPAALSAAVFHRSFQFRNALGPFGGYYLAARPHVLLSVTLSQTRLVC